MSYNVVAYAKSAGGEGMIFKCHDCESEFDEKYAVYYETPGNPKCPVCGGSVAGIRPADLPEPEAHKLSYMLATDGEEKV